MQDTDRSEFYAQLPIPVEPPIDKTPSPNDPPWGTGIAIGVWMFSVFLIVIFPTFFLIAYLATLGMPLKETEAVVEFAKNDKMAVLVQVLAIFPAHILTFLAAWLVVTRNRTYSFFKTLGWKSGGIRWWQYPAILLAFFALAIVVSNFFPDKPNDLLRIIQSSRLVAIMVAILATFTAPIVEEVVYRGILYSAFQRTINPPAAFLLVTILFLAVHVPQYYPSYSTIFLLGMLSVTLTALRVRSKNLLPCIILHTLFNGLQSILIIFGPDTKIPDPTAFFNGLIN